MNDDHADSVVAIVKHYLQVPCFGAELVGMDKLGMTVSHECYNNNNGLLIAMCKSNSDITVIGTNVCTHLLKCCA